ncbi:MAG: type I restriction enzyme HsdR N-terminal domain-containing protein, partial [Cytophagales bacterium]|nr:type I restriction enzyme HsdR N-terminal domain-containing protein [Cytophagales bacterium]
MIEISYGFDSHPRYIEKLLVITLNIPACKAQISKTPSGVQYIFDILRKKNVRLTGEEWVRQHVIHYLIHHLGYPPSLIKLEATRPVQLASCKGRADIIVF